MRLESSNLTIPTRKILLIGEEEFFHWCLAHELQSFGYEVTHARDLQAGEHFLKEFTADLIIYDRDFSFQESLSIFSHWMERNAAKNSILMTAATPPSYQEINRASAKVCLSKPFPMKDFIQQVESVFAAS